MRRRDCRRIVGAVSLAPAATDARASTAPPSTAATVLYGDRAVPLDRIGRDPRKPGDALWVWTRDLPRVNGFELTPQGACRADLCIPIPTVIRRRTAASRSSSL